MTETLIKYGAGLFAIVGTLFGIWWAGRAKGKESARAEYQAAETEKREQTEAIKQEIDAIVKEAEKESNAQNIDDVRNRLKSSSVRKPYNKD